jgi:prepilin-type N-terminal cleavage/methylation domain-containing protein
MLKKLKNSKSQNEGFTIIEVMIVLAIAGLIMLIVFLAVPALQRTSRNTQRKNDASAVASAMSNYASDNAGGIPDSATYSNGLVTFGCTNTTLAGAAGCTYAATGGNTETAKVGYYTTFPTFVSPPSGTPAAPSTSGIEIDLGYDCNASGTGVGAATPRDAAVLFEVESGGSTNSEQCIET